jgi:hypothetical protein
VFELGAARCERVSAGLLIALERGGGITLRIRVRNHGVDPPALLQIVITRLPGSVRGNLTPCWQAADLQRIASFTRRSNLSAPERLDADHPRWLNRAHSNRIPSGAYLYFRHTFTR